MTEILKEFINGIEEWNAICSYHYVILIRGNV